MIFYILIKLTSLWINVHLEDQSRIRLVDITNSEEYRRAIQPEVLKHYYHKAVPVLTHSNVVELELDRRITKKESDGHKSKVPMVKPELDKAKVEEHIEVPKPQEPQEIDSSVLKYKPKIKITPRQ